MPAAIPLARNAVTFSFCQTARSDRTAIAIFVSKRMRPGSLGARAVVLNAGARQSWPAGPGTRPGVDGGCPGTGFCPRPGPSPGRSAPLGTPFPGRRARAREPAYWLVGTGAAGRLDAVLAVGGRPGRGDARRIPRARLPPAQPRHLLP